MNIALKSEHADWIAAAISDGRFTSVEAAIEAALSALIEDYDNIHDGHDDWVAPLLDEARKDIAHGDTMSIEEFRAQRQSQTAGG